MSINDITDFNSDTVTIATGATWRNDFIGSTNFDPIETNTYNILTPEDIILEKFKNSHKTKFIIYDDDHNYMASVIAEKLLNNDHDVTYVTPLPTVSTWTQYTLEQAAIIERLKSLGIKFALNYKINQNFEFVNTINNKKLKLNSKNIIVVGGRIPNDQLYDDCKLIESLQNVFLTGDCLVPGTIQAAVLSGHQIAEKFYK